MKTCLKNSKCLMFSIYCMFLLHETHVFKCCINSSSKKTDCATMEAVFWLTFKTYSYCYYRLPFLFSDYI